jgi:hypothetical protein
VSADQIVVHLAVDPARGTKPTISCSFCGKAASEVEKIIAGPSVRICSECIGLCNDIMQAESRERDSRPGPEDIAAYRRLVDCLVELVEKRIPELVESRDIAKAAEVQPEAVDSLFLRLSIAERETLNQLLATVSAYSIAATMNRLRLEGWEVRKNAHGLHEFARDFTDDFEARLDKKSWSQPIDC